jgi:hypothetical protein
MTTRTTSIWISACTSVQRLLENPFSLDLNADQSRESVLEICRQCREDGHSCESDPIELRLTITAEQV